MVVPLGVGKPFQVLKRVKSWHLGSTLADKCYTFHKKLISESTVDQKASSDKKLNIM